MALLEVEERVEVERRSPQIWVKINRLDRIFIHVLSDLGVLVLFGPGVIRPCRRVQ